MPRERKLFDDAVSMQRNNDEIGFIRCLMALGILHYYKYDRAIEETNDQTAMFDGVRLQAIADNFTERNIGDFYKLADRQLDDYAWKEIPSERDSPTKSPSFWSGVAQSIFASFLYSLVIVAVFLIIKFSGGDLLNILKDVFK